MGVRQWRRIIFRDTEAKPHYRSVSSTSETSRSTPVSTDLSTTFTRPALLSDIASPFWTPAGGLQDKDFGEAGPVFRDDKVIRGGYAKITISNRTDTEALHVKVFAVWASINPDQTRMALVNSTIQAREWDPSMFPDFQKLGKVLYSRECILRPGDNPFDVTHRLKPQKLDDDVFLNNRGSQLIWMVKVVKMTSTDVIQVQQNLLVTYSFNLSFSADATT